MVVLGVLAVITGVLLTGGPATPANAAGGSTITGRITEAGTGEPIAGVRVRLATRSHRTILRTVRTDANGRCRFTGVGLGSFLIGADRNHDFISAYYGDTVHLGRAKVVRVTGTATYTRNIHLRRAAVVTGRVVDPDGNLVTGGYVTAHSVTSFGEFPDAGYTEELHDTGRSGSPGSPAGPS